MEDVKTRSQLDPSYDGDFFAWTQEQGRRLRETRPNRIDWEIAEEIDCLGRSEKRSIEGNLPVVLLHLLKWQYQAGGRNNSWRKSIVEHRKRIRREITDSPSLRHYPSEVLAEEYEIARLGASGETGLPETVLPEVCPYTVEQVQDADFWPDPPPG